MTDRRKAERLALVLPGGGARCAFQVGVLKAVSELLPPRARNPFRILSGTSAGAINSVVLASKAQRFHFAVRELERVWGNFETSKVYKSDALTMLKSSLHWLAASASAIRSRCSTTRRCARCSHATFASGASRPTSIAASSTPSRLRLPATSPRARSRSTRASRRSSPGRARGASASARTSISTTSWRALPCR